MIVEKITVNVGEDQSIYVEVYPGDTPVTALKYGDVTFNERDEITLWYGNDESEMTGWCTPKWNTASISNAIVKNIRDSKNHAKDCIYRILNNDIDFNEEEYKKELGVTYEH